jgi:branched-chain amino acid transport system substrate-binding protein
MKGFRKPTTPSSQKTNLSSSGQYCYSRFNEGESKMKARYMLVSVLVLLAMVLSSCAPAATPTVAPTAAPTEPAAVEPTATTAPAAVEPTATIAAMEPTATVETKEDPCATDKIGCAKIAPGTTIKIGMGAPMTGDYAQFGIDISQGAQIAVEDGGDIEGFKFELVAEDDQGSPELGAAVANKFVSDPNIVAVAGHIFSGATAAADPIYEKAGIPMMSPSATNPALTTKGSTVFNRVAFSDTAQGKFAAEYLYNTLGFKKIAVMHDGTDYGQALSEVTSKTFIELGGEVVDTQAITPGETDYTAPLSAIAAKAPEAVYFGGYNAEAVVMANQWAQAGLKGVVLFSDDGVYGEDFLTRAGKNAEGVYSVGPSILPDSTEKGKFDEAYQSKFAKKAGELSPFTWNAYDSAAALIAAIKSVAFKGDDGNLYIPRAALVAAVRGMKDFKGLTGSITCDPTGECGATGPTFYLAKDGMWEAVK